MKTKNVDIIPGYPSNVYDSLKVNFDKNIDPTNFDIKVNHLDFQQQTKMDRLLENFKLVFAKDKCDVGTMKDYETHIELLIDKYCYKRPYRCSIEDKREIEQKVSKSLEKNLIEESYSPFAAPVILAYKKRRREIKILYRFT